VNADRPLETGWLPDTPVGDTVMRRFLLSQADLDEELARAMGGTAARTDDVSMAYSGGPVPFFNMSTLLRPLQGQDDPVLDDVEGFVGDTGGPAMLLSIWPTPPLDDRGWTLVGHPAFVARPAGPLAPKGASGVEVREARDADTLALVERIAIEGYPLDEAKGAPVGSVFPPALLDTDVLYRVGLVDGEPVAAAGRYVSSGVVNLCFAATLPAARRRGVWGALVRARIADVPDLPAVAFTSDYSRPGFEHMGFLVVTRFTLWLRP
jgi:hypothetical protein